MITIFDVNYINFQENIEFYLDKVAENNETIIITKKDNKNVVVLSEESYNNIMENIYVMGNNTNLD